MKKCIFVGLFVLSASNTFAQAARPTDKFQWTMEDSGLAIVQAFRYELELDNVVRSAPLVTTCVTSPPPAVNFTCTAPIPAITPSNHMARVRGVDIADTAPFIGEWSDPLNFNMRAAPSKPGNLKIIPGGN